MSERAEAMIASLRAEVDGMRGMIHKLAERLELVEDLGFDTLRRAQDHDVTLRDSKERLLALAILEEPSIAAAARRLGVNPKTLFNCRLRLIRRLSEETRSCPICGTIPEERCEP